MVLKNILRKISDEFKMTERRYKMHEEGMRKHLLYYRLKWPITLILKGELRKVIKRFGFIEHTTTTTKSLQSCPTLCDPTDGSPPGSPVPGILQARTLEWVAVSFSNAWQWKWKRSRSVVSDSSRPHGLQPTRLLRPWDFPGKSTGVGCHCLLLI